MLKSNRIGSVWVLANSPVVGWKNKRTGAVWRPSCWKRVRIRWCLHKYRRSRGHNTYRHEGIPAIVEVEGSKDDSGVALLVTLCPGVGQKIPLGAEFATHLAGIAVVHGRQQHGDRVVTGKSRDLLVGSIFELDGRRGEGFLVEVLKLLAGRLCCQDARRQQGEGHEDRGPAHRERRMSRAPGSGSAVRVVVVVE